MKNPIRILLSILLIALAVYLFRDAHSAYDDENAVDSSRAILLFGGVVLVGAAAGILLAFSVMPQIAEGIGNLFFHPNEKIEKNPHADAMGAIARGEYEQAIEEYRKVYERNPEDNLALSEMARLYCEKLHNPQPAAEILEAALQRELLPEDAAFICTRLADLYWTHQHNAAGARALLLQVIETMPNTRHSANASHKIQEIERQLTMHG
jgi:tetratricopeptide (TPR) repeat protein